MEINEVDATAREEIKEVAQPAAIESIANDIGQDKVDKYLKEVQEVLGEINNY